MSGLDILAEAAASLVGEAGAAEPAAREGPDQLVPIAPNVTERVTRVTYTVLNTDEAATQVSRKRAIPCAEDSSLPDDNEGRPARRPNVRRKHQLFRPEQRVARGVLDRHAGSAHPRQCGPNVHRPPVHLLLSAHTCRVWRDCKCGYEEWE